MINNECINEVIAEWIGFEEKYTANNRSGWWEYEGYPYAGCPNFMHSETDCFKWIVPKLTGEGYGLDITVSGTGTFASLWKLDRSGDDLTSATAIGMNSSVATAICMAVIEYLKIEWVNYSSFPWHL